MSIPLLINKEHVAHVQFHSKEVLSNPLEIQKRNLLLQKALKLGNTYKSHVKLVFLNAQGETMSTVATVWAITERFVVLKSNMMIPITSVLRVELVA